jgi:hypothetical protein
MTVREKTLATQGRAEHNETYNSTNVRKTLDTTCGGAVHRFYARLVSRTKADVEEQQTACFVALGGVLCSPAI